MGASRPELFRGRHFRDEIIVLCVRWYLRYPLSFRQLEEIMAGVWKELIQRGVRIPQEMSLCGFGDREEFQILEPSLTTMAVFPENLGGELARMLLQRLQQPDGIVESRMRPCRLIERNSSAPRTSRLQAVRR